MEESLNLTGRIEDEFGIKHQNMASYSPLTLAFVGDCVYELVVRTIVTESGNRPAKDLHKMKVKYVKAAAQAKIADSLDDILDDHEKDIYRRGRNAKSATMAKNATMADYRKATGLEALCGYLYLDGRLDRAIEIIKHGMEIVDNE